MSVIPAHVLHSWDFKPYRVCRDAKEILNELYHLPAFAVLDINPRLYALSPALFAVRVRYLNLFITRMSYLTGAL